MESQRRKLAIIRRWALVVSILVGIFFAPQSFAANKCEGMGCNVWFPGIQYNLESPNGFAEYVVSFYQFFLSALAIMAVAVIMFAGYEWMFAQGNPGKIGKARDRAVGAVVGLILALSAWVILNTIDPNIVKLELPNLQSIAEMNSESIGICPFNELVQDTLLGITTGQARCGHKYYRVGSNEPCWGYITDRQNDVCYFAQDTLRGLQSETPVYHAGETRSNLGSDLLTQMAWPGGIHDQASSVDVDCHGHVCDDDDTEALYWPCGTIYYGTEGFNEYIMSTECRSGGNTRNRCVLISPLRFIDTYTVGEPNDGGNETQPDSGTGVIKGAQCWGGQ